MTTRTLDAAGRTLAALADDITLDAVRLDGRALDAQIASAVTSATLERTIEGASTLTFGVHDPDRTLLTSGIFAGAVDVELDGLWFRLVKVGKSGDAVTLVFEDRAVALLRQRRKYRKASRAAMTRAEFALSLVREIKSHPIEFVAPELHTKQAIGVGDTRDDRDRRREKGIPDRVDLSIGTPDPRNADRRQRDLMERALAVAETERAGLKATKALVAACIVEDRFRNRPLGDSSSVGILQLLDIHMGGSVRARMDVERVCRTFLRDGFTGKGGAMQLARSHPDWTAGQVAQAVQGSAYPRKYDAVGSQADKVIDAWGGVGEAQAGAVRRKSYEFTRGEPGKPEDSWAALGRLADEVGWRRFMVGDALYFVSEEDLFSSRARMVVRERDAGVDLIDFDVDYGKKVAEATVGCRASRWAAPPGSVVVVDGVGDLADGRWLVASIGRDLFSRQTRITLRKPIRERPEPEAETVQVTDSRTGTGATGSTRDRIVEAAEWALKHKSEYWYDMSGAPPLPNLKTRPVRGHRFDCSWFVTLAYKAADAPDPNGNSYRGGFTGTLREHGKRTNHPKPGDLVHYGPGSAGSASHVALYVGDGKAIGIGGNAAGIHRHPARYRGDFAGYWTHDLDDD